jgi:hypothetical protein
MSRQIDGKHALHAWPPATDPTPEAREAAVEPPEAATASLRAPLTLISQVMTARPGWRLRSPVSSTWPACCCSPRFPLRLRDGEIGGRTDGLSLRPALDLLRMKKCFLAARAGVQPRERKRTHRSPLDKTRARLQGGNTQDCGSSD